MKEAFIRVGIFGGVVMFFAVLIFGMPWASAFFQVQERNSLQWACENRGGEYTWRLVPGKNGENYQELLCVYP